MRFFLVLLTLSLTAPTASAANLFASFDLVETNIATFDSVTFSAGPNVDVYHFSICNSFVNDVTAFELSLSGPFVNQNPSAALTFQAGTDLPMLGPHVVAESFFVLPEGFSANDVLAVNTTDGNGLLASTYTLPGTISLADAGERTVVAVLSVPTGPLLDAFNNSTGRGAVYGQFEGIFALEPLNSLPEGCLPEPSTALLCLIGMAGIVVRRRS